VQAITDRKRPPVRRRTCPTPPLRLAPQAPLLPPFCAAFAVLSLPLVVAVGAPVVVVVPPPGRAY